MARAQRQIGLWRERLAIAHRFIFLTDDVPEAAGQRRVIRCRKAPGLRPHGECSVLHGGSEHLLKMVPRIGRHRHRNPLSRRFSNRLNFVVLFGEKLRPSIQSRDESVYMISVNELADLRQVILLADAVRRQRAGTRQRAVHHQPGQVFETHAPHQVGDPDLRRQSPVLVGIELPVFD